MKAFAGTIAGTGPLVRLIIRRDRFVMPLWVLPLAVLPVTIAGTMNDLYPTAAERQSYIDIVTSTPAFLALYGHAFGHDLGAVTAWRLGGTVLFVGLASLLTVIRHTRTEEEAGRRELLGATVVGRQAPLLAALFVTLGADLVLGALAAAGLVAYGLPAAGSVAFGLSWALFGWVFAALAAVMAQATEGARTARGILVAILGLCLVLRMAADVGKEDGLSWLSWFTPFGWIQRIHLYSDQRWWVLLLFAGVTAGFVTSALALSARRDLGSGLLPTRPGHAAATPWLRSPLGLAWRLQRGSLVTWTLGFATLGAVLGGVAQGGVEVIQDNPQLRAVAARLGGTSGLADTYFAAIMGLLGLVAAGYAIGAALRLRNEEANVRLEPVLAVAVSRWRWASSHLTFATVGPAVLLTAAGVAAGLTYGLVSGGVGHEVPRVLGAAVAQLPAVWVLVGIAVALFGVLPRFAASVGWAVLAACVLLEEFGKSLQLSKRVLDLSPFSHIPKVPGGDVTAAPFVWLTLIAAALIAAGLVGFRRRDVL
jgi:ABC-2 type transport system permease protein